MNVTYAQCHIMFVNKLFICNCYKDDVLCRTIMIYNELKQKSL